MRIVEIKAQNIKIIFKPAQNQLKIGDFVSFTEGDLTLIAQVFRIVSSAVADDFNQADLYFVLSYQYEKIKPWAGEVLSAEAVVEKTPISFLEKSMNLTNVETKVALGEYLEYPNSALELDIRKFSTPAFIGYEKFSDCENLIKCIQNSFLQAEKKFVLIDFYGNMNFSNSTKLKAGYQVKLPLNSKLLDNLCGKILEGISIESKAVIEDILLELSQYADQNQLGFIPISQLLKVIDDIYQKSKISQLMLLKNRLRKYQKLGIFADDISEVYAIFNELELSSSIIFDLANVPLEWRKDFINSLLDLNNKAKKDFYIFYNLDEQNSDNSMINTVLFKTAHTGIKPILASNYRYLSFENIYDFSQNIFLFNTYNALKKRANICDILQSLPQNSFMLSGSLTNGLIICAIPLLNQDLSLDKNNNYSKEKEGNDFFNKSVETEKIIPNTQYSFSPTETPIKKIDMELMNSALQPELSINLQVPEEKDFSLCENFKEIAQAEILETSVINKAPLDTDINVSENENNISVVNNDDNIEFQEEIATEISPQKLEEIDEDEIIIEPIIDTVEEKDNNNLEQEITASEIIEPAKNLFDDEDENIHIEDINEFEEFEQNTEDLYKEDVEQKTEAETEYLIEDLDLDDLDFLTETEEASFVQKEQQIDSDDDLLDLLEDDDILLEKETAEDVAEVDFEEINNIDNNDDMQEDFSRQKLPIYNADYSASEVTSKNNSIFQEGDLVKHSKYGIGTIKKLTSHGDKVLCHINFEDFGRRLLDPDISQLEKIQ